MSIARHIRPLGASARCDRANVAKVSITVDIRAENLFHQCNQSPLLRTIILKEYGLNRIERIKKLLLLKYYDSKVLILCLQVSTKTCKKAKLLSKNIVTLSHIIINY